MANHVVGADEQQYHFGALAGKQGIDPVRDLVDPLAGVTLVLAVGKFARTVGLRSDEVDVEAGGDQSVLEVDPIAARYVPAVRDGVTEWHDSGGRLRWRHRDENPRHRAEQEDEHPAKAQRDETWEEDFLSKQTAQGIRSWSARLRVDVRRQLSHGADHVAPLAPPPPSRVPWSWARLVSNQRPLACEDQRRHA